MELYLNNVQLPVLPTSFSISNSKNNTVINVPTKGDVNLIGTDGLREITLESFFPDKDYDFLQCPRQEPETYKALIESWKDKAIQFIATGIINIPVTIESTVFTYDVDGDLKYQISLKEYRSNTNNTRTSITYPVKSYTIKTNHTTRHGLRLLAKKYLGNTKYATTIYTDNKTAIEKAAKKHGLKSSQSGKYLFKGTQIMVKK